MNKAQHAPSSSGLSNDTTLSGIMLMALSSACNMDQQPRQHIRVQSTALMSSTYLADFGLALNKVKLFVHKCQANLLQV